MRRTCVGHLSKTHLIRLLLSWLSGMWKSFYWPNPNPDPNPNPNQGCGEVSAGAGRRLPISYAFHTH